MDDNELKKILESVPDAYDFFVSGLLHSLKKDEDQKKIADYIIQNKDSDTSSVLEYYADEIRHIPKFNS